MAVNIVRQIDDGVKIRNVLVSVSDKAGLDRFIPELAKLDARIRIYSTGGTYKALSELLDKDTAARQLAQVSDYTGQPEMQGGLVKTLDFKIYLGLLSETYNPEHQNDLKRAEAVAIDMVVVNLYPFSHTIAKAGVTPEEARANIDIGGPCMIRAAAKNFLRVASVTAPGDYPAILDELKKTGGVLSLKTRFELAVTAFAHTAQYDTVISDYLAQRDFAEVEKSYRIV
ncbi:MAG: hypothetical protein HY343_00460 [Lentisphaerae bacterium]|nr:hypothetical protein [Lentisphaerota bacterium]